SRYGCGGRGGERRRRDRGRRRGRRLPRRAPEPCRACQEGQHQHPPPTAGGRAHIHIAATLEQTQCRRSYFVAKTIDSATVAESWTVIGCGGLPPCWT